MIPTLDTKKKLLDTAEKLFGEKGFEATSLRDITTEAQVNLAAVNYHFRSKRALMRAVFARRLEPLNQKRLALLETCMAARANGPPDLERLVEALVAPPVRPPRPPNRPLSPSKFRISGREAAQKAPATDLGEGYAVSYGVGKPSAPEVGPPPNPLVQLPPPAPRRAVGRSAGANRRLAARPDTIPPSA